MKPFLPSIDDLNPTPLYIQLYRHIKASIISGDLLPGERLPSLRSIAAESGISVTTSGLAYNQLLTEGYIESRPQSGYYVMDIPDLVATLTSSSSQDSSEPTSPAAIHATLDLDLGSRAFDQGKYIYDLSAFDFQKWKKCNSRVYNQYAHLLLTESDTQGELALRFEICKYLFSSRGVSATPDQVVIGAGVQQLTIHLSRILSLMGIDLVCTEDPGYLPIQNIFRDRGFSLNKIPVTENGIDLDKLPINIPTAVYVSPANQFPTGSVMPVAARHRLLNWARANKSIIIEDDYDSELRYFGKPIPALKGLDEEESVVYLGSFSSTLFPSIKISYMVLPQPMANIFSEIKTAYTQTCSKTEQLTLALFMEDGYYYTGIKKLRNLYAQKLTLAVEAFNKYAGSLITPINTQSGINMTLMVASPLTAEELCARGESLKLHLSPLASIASAQTAALGSSASADSAAACTAAPQSKRHLIFYYNQIPIGEIDSLIHQLVDSWNS